MARSFLRGGIRRSELFRAHQHEKLACLFQAAFHLALLQDSLVSTRFFHLFCLLLDPFNHSFKIPHAHERVHGRQVVRSIAGVFRMRLLTNFASKNVDREA